MKFLEAQSTQKEYEDQNVRDMDSMDSEQVFLKVSHINDVMRFGNIGKISPRYIGPDILKLMGLVDYRLSFLKFYLELNHISYVHAKEVSYLWELHYSLGFSHVV